MVAAFAAAARLGILIKQPNFLEAAGHVDALVMDKTGTMTTGKFEVSRLVPAPGLRAEVIRELKARGEPLAVVISDQRMPGLQGTEVLAGSREMYPLARRVMLTAYSDIDAAVKAIRAEGIGLDALLHAGSSDVVRFGLTPLHYDMLRMGGMLFENPSPDRRSYTWKTRILQVKTLPKGWGVDYGGKVTLERETRVGLVAHIPNDELTYLVRGQVVNKLLDHEYVITLDLSRWPDIREGEEVNIIFPEPYPLQPSSSTPVTLRDGAGPERPERRDGQLVQQREE